MNETESRRSWGVEEITEKKKKGIRTNFEKMSLIRFLLYFVLTPVIIIHTLKFTHIVYTQSGWVTTLKTILDVSLPS